MPNDDTIFLKSKVDVLGFFNEDQLRRVTPDIERQSYNKGETVVFKGEVTSGFYIVKKGKVTLLIKGKDGAPKAKELPAGDFFGEISILEDAPMEGTVKAAEDGTEVLTIPSRSFQKLLEMMPIMRKSLTDKIIARRAAG